MDIMVRIPDDLARRLGTVGELERLALEALAIVEYRRGYVNRCELRRLFELDSDEKLESFLKANDLPMSTLDAESRARARAAAGRIRTMSKGARLGGLKIEDLINEGRL
jgi:hypothetical protein